MRRNRSRAVGLAAAIPTAIMGATIEPAAAGQARGTLGVTVQVIANCTADLNPSGGVALAEGCESSSAAPVVATETAAPASFQAAGNSLPAEGPTAAAEPDRGDSVRYITLLY
jgi:hypothetical protein